MTMHCRGALYKFDVLASSCLTHKELQVLKPQRFSLALLDRSLLLPAPPMASLLVISIAVAAMALMVVQPTAFAARTSPAAAAEAFWRAAMPSAPMPVAILELLHHEHDLASAGGKANGGGDDPPPPMNFNYDDYRALPRSDALAAPSPDVLNRVTVQNADENGVSSPPPTTTTVFFLEDTVRVGESLPLPRAAAATELPLRLYTVRSVRPLEGSIFVVCRGEAAGAGAGVYGCHDAATAATGPARAYAVDAAGGEGGGDAVITVVVCHTDTSRWDPDYAAFRLLGVRPGGAAVCRAVADAHILPTKD